MGDDPEKPIKGQLVSVAPVALPTSTAPGATSDEAVIAAWLRSKRSAHTRRNYAADVRAFRTGIPKALGEVTLQEIQDWADSLTGAPKTRARRITAVKSLYSFAAKIQYVRFNPAAVVPVPQDRNRLSERILLEEEVLAMRKVVHKGSLFVRFLYFSGARLEEALRLRWRDCLPRDAGGQVTLFGKGQKTRAVLLPKGFWAHLVAAKPADAKDDDTVFQVSARTAERWVREIAKQAGIKRAVSPHWLRHAYATHALRAGASLHAISTDLGHSNISTTSTYLHALPQDSVSRFLKDDD